MEGCKPSVKQWSRALLLPLPEFPVRRGQLQHGKGKRTSVAKCQFIDPDHKYK
jgi:hypothetical protein